MKQPRGIVSGLTILVLLVLAPVAAGLTRQPFEGTRWKVIVTPDEDARSAGEKEFEDILIFKGGKFVAEACVTYGFGPVEYQEEMSPGGLTATFTAEPKSAKEGTAKWRGTAMAADMTGEMTWTKPDGTVLNYTFKGERLAK